MKESTFKFDTDFMTGHAIPIAVLRIYLKSGSIVGLWFGPDGVVMSMGEQCQDNGDIIWVGADNLLSPDKLKGDEKT